MELLALLGPSGVIRTVGVDLLRVGRAHGSSDDALEELLSRQGCPPARPHAAALRRTRAHHAQRVQVKTPAVSSLSRLSFSSV